MTPHVFAVILIGTKLLLLKDAASDQWAFPNGSLNPQERAFDCVKRLANKWLKGAVLPLLNALTN